jgi:hypothetical protein
MNTQVRCGSEQISKSVFEDQIVWSCFSGFIMSFRWKIMSLILTVVSPHFVSGAVAAEAATPDPAVRNSGSLGRMEKAGIVARLAKSGFQLNGDLRHKGQFILLNATKEGADWRLVLDGNTGEIIGKRPAAPVITVSQ